MAVKKNRIYRILRDLKAIISSGYSLVLVIVLWELVARIINFDLFLPSFSSVIVLFFKMLYSLELIPHIYVSLMRTLVGFFMAVAVGVPLGLIMGWSPHWEKFWSPIISLVYPIPKIGLIPSSLAS